MHELRSRVTQLLVLLCTLSVLATLLVRRYGDTLTVSNQVRVWGKVTCQGKPVTNGAVIFRPAEPLHTNWGVGQIDKDGKYSMSAHIPEAALQPGSYQVYLRPSRPTVAEVNGNPRARIKAEDAELEHHQSSPETVTFKPPIPDRFLDPSTSGINVGLGPSMNRVDIDLTN